jgi:two-component system, sensor histidine kinase YesM
VIDNGVGMPEDQIKGLFESEETAVSRNSFGLKSVAERIKLYFGEEFGLKITSEPGKGTVITIKMPKNAGRVPNV